MNVGPRDCPADQTSAREESQAKIQEVWVQVLAVQQIPDVTLGKSLLLFVPQLPVFQPGDNNPSRLYRDGGRINPLVDVMGSEVTVVGTLILTQRLLLSESFT